MEINKGKGRSQLKAPPPKAAANHLGITPPISLTAPTPWDSKLTRNLQIDLKAQGLLSTEEELKQVAQILDALESLLQEWIEDVCDQRSNGHQKKSSGARVSGGGKIYDSGLYRLGVHCKGDVIEALCVVSRQISRSDYFGSFFEVLAEQPDIQDLRRVRGDYEADEDSFMPAAIKMTTWGYQFELTFARLALTGVPEKLELTKDQLLKNLDSKCVRSLNGCRIPEEILRQVPNVVNFRTTLKVVVLWAKAHGLYGHVQGYLGGISLSILVARTCQLYPNAVPASLVKSFFHVFSAWHWPNPVFLKMPDESTNFGFPVWDPRVSETDNRHVMPIITPVYPHHNSACNSVPPCLQLIVDEFHKGLNKIQMIYLNQANWSLLYQLETETSKFFTKYKRRHYIGIFANSNSEVDQLAWSASVEARLVFLVTALDGHKLIHSAQVWPTAFPSMRTGTDLYACQWFIGLEFEKCGNVDVDVTRYARDFKESVELDHVLKPKRRKLATPLQVNLQVEYVRRKNLNLYLPASILGRRKDVAPVNNPKDEP